MSLPTIQSIHSLYPDSARTATSTAYEDIAPEFQVYTATIKELSSRLSEGTLTSVEIVNTYLGQIEQWNGKLNALISVAPRDQVMRLARERDEERRVGMVRGLVHGIPVVVKDNIATDVKLGMPTTAGSYALLGMPVKQDAFLVRRLRDAGAIIIGKANLTELASYKSLDAQNGWSAVGGQTINAYNSKASPGNSSAGNGVSVAAGFCPASIATETDGSIVLPALASALYALKPTVGLISRSGVVPLARYFDTPGPMARCVWDLAGLMDVLCAIDVEDQTTETVERLPEGYIDCTVNPSFQDYRIGVPRTNWHNAYPWTCSGELPLSPHIAEAFEEAINITSANGATIIDPADIPSAVDGSLWSCRDGARSLVVNAGFKEDMGRYLRGLGGEGGVRSVDDLIRFNEEHADIEMPTDHEGQDVLLRTRFAVATSSAEYKEAVQEMHEVADERGLDAVFKNTGADVLFSIGSGGRHSLANMVGYPMGVIPLGVSLEGTPFGAIFIGRKCGEGTLLGVMRAWEQAYGDPPLPSMASETPYDITK